MNQEIEKNLFKYHMLIPAIPFPFDGNAVASTGKAALKKIIFQAKQCGIKAWGPALEIEKMAYIKEKK